jgi:hypothetical protein
MANQSGAYQMFSSQVSTNGSYNMTTADIGKLFSYDVTSSPTFSLTNANLFASGQAIGFLVDSGTTNTLSNKLTIIPSNGNTINSVTNISFVVQHDSVILVSDGVSKWHPMALQSSSGCYYYDATSFSVADGGDHLVVFDSATSVNYDTSNFHSTSADTTKFYARVGGLYYVRLEITYETASGNNGDNVQLYVKLNGTSYPAGTKTYIPSGSGAAIGTTSTMIYLHAGDYIESYLTHVRNSDNNNVSFTDARFSITRIQ